MTGGQTSLALSAGSEESDVGTESAIRRLVSGRKSLKIIRASADEIQAHESRLDLIEKKKVTSRCGVNRGAMRRLLFLVMLIPVLSWAKDSTAMSWLDNRFRVDPTVEQVSFVVKREDKSRSIVLVRPDGKKYYSWRHPDNVAWYDEPGMDIISIENPMPGHGKLSVK